MRAGALARTLLAAAFAAAFLMRPSAQSTPVPPTIADLTATLAEAQRQYADRRYENAAAAFARLRDGGHLIHDDVWEGRGLLGLGSVALLRGRTDEGRTTLLQALELFEKHRDIASHEIGQVSLTLGNLEEGANRPSEAVKHYEHAVAAFAASHDDLLRVRSEYNILFAKRIDPPALDPAMEAVLNDARAIGSTDLEASVLHLWGDRVFSLGDFERAVEKDQEAAAILEHSSTGAEELGTIYNSLGRLYRVHGQTKVALAYQLKALALHEKVGVPFGRIQSANAVAATYLDLGDLSHAKQYYERAIALAEATTGTTPRTLSFLRASYGDLLLVMGDAARGRALIAQAIPDSVPTYLSLRYSELATADLVLGNPRAALDDDNQAMAHCPEASTVDCIVAQLDRARSELALGDEGAALADQEAVLARIEDQRSKLAASDFLRQGFEQMTVPVYSQAIALQLHQGRTRDALETAEQGRSRALLDLLASRAAPATIVAAPSSAPQSDVVGSAAAAISRQSRAFAHAATVPELVATAQRLHSTLLLYWVSDRSIDAWTVAPDGAVASAVTPMPRAKLEALIRATTAFAASDAPTGASITTRGGQAIPVVAAPQPAWRELYDALIQPIARSLPAAAGARLTIIPHGPLMVVPFAALRDRTGKYLIERYAIQTAPTGGLFEFTKAASRADARTGTALLVSNPAGLPAVSGEAPLAALPGAEAEVQAIARLLAGRATVLSAATASEPRVVDAIGRAAIVHFATHAVVRDANPAASFLALGRPTDGSASGELTPDKIYALSVPADLVVLSACRSGGGAPNGDGIAALARAFFYAGASSVVASVWDVADAPANRLLPAFYRAWLGGADKASALRTAQLRLLADLRAGRVTVRTALGDVVLPEDPSFWAGFVLIGEAD